MTSRVPVVLFVAAMAMPALSGLFRVWVNQDAVNVGYELSEQAKHRRELRDLIRRLDVQLAAERSPERLTEIAYRLGLAPPRADRVFGSARPGAAHGP